eukprot:1066510-Amphidinium_carterae.1
MKQQWHKLTCSLKCFDSILPDCRTGKPWGSPFSRCLVDYLLLTGEWFLAEFCGTFGDTILPAAVVCPLTIILRRLRVRATSYADA